jgi:pimeloyl-ACP methyl ester carboxylesterase
MQGVMLPLLLDSRQADPAAGGILRGMFNMAAPDAREGSAPEGSAAVRAARATQPHPEHGYHEPSACTSFRLKMLRSGDLPHGTLSRIHTPTLLICSAQDRLFPSMREGARQSCTLRLAQTAQCILLRQLTRRTAGDACVKALCRMHAACTRLGAHA